MQENKYRILVVDDEEDLCEILRFNMETEGYLVDTAHSAEEALQTDISNYDLLLLDVMMGEMSGFALAKRLKENESTSKTPLIFLTARDTENDTITGFNLGADDYISKPFSIREVLLRIRAVLHRTHPQHSVSSETSANILQHEKLEIDIDKKTVNVEGKEVAFTKTEFELLRLLLKEKGRVFSRQELIDKVWPRDVLVLDRTVDVYITRVRKKIGKYSPCIATRQGFGYYFEN